MGNMLRDVFKQERKSHHGKSFSLFFLTWCGAVVVLWGGGVECTDSFNVHPDAPFFSIFTCIYHKHQPTVGI